MYFVESGKESDKVVLQFRGAGWEKRDLKRNRLRDDCSPSLEKCV